MDPKKNRKRLLINIFFVIICGGILVFLINAPDETTSFLPHDETHNRFHKIESKREAGKFCVECHDQDKVAPLPEEHPPKFRCLFCHKRK